MNARGSTPFKIPAGVAYVFAAAVGCFILAIAGFLALVFGGFAFYSGSGNNANANLATQSRPLASPSGRYMLHVLPAAHPREPGVAYQSFQIRRKDAPSSEAPVLSATDIFRARDTTYFLWDDADRVWVYSGDIGTFYWEQDAAGTWRKQSHPSGTAPVPPLLKQLRPKVFADQR